MVKNYERCNHLPWVIIVKTFKKIGFLSFFLEKPLKFSLAPLAKKKKKW